MNDKDTLKVFLCIAISILFFGIFRPVSYVMLPVVIIGSMSLGMSAVLIINKFWREEN